MTKKTVMLAAGSVVLSCTVAAAVFFLRADDQLGPKPAATVVSDSQANAGGEQAPQDGMRSVRRLFGIQDRIAKGDRTAIPMQDESIAFIASEFNAFADADWNDHRNVQAAMAYVLSGGETEVIERFIESHATTKEQEALAKGVLSFVRNRPKTAIRQIGYLEPSTLEGPLVGVFALALASLHAADDHRRGVALFDEARLHAPSTAVEEAAIRREVPLLLKNGDTPRAVLLISRYVRVFGNSPFAPRFYADVSDGFVRLPETIDQSALVAHLEDTLREEAAHKKSVLFLRMARTALLSGKVMVAKAAADVVSNMAMGAIPEKQKAKLYAAAAVAATEDAESVITHLAELGGQVLEEEDQSIRVAATQIARSVIDAPSARSEPSRDEPASTLRPDANRTSDDAIAAVSATITQADKALLAADLLISKLKQ